MSITMEIVVNCLPIVHLPIPMEIVLVVIQDLSSIPLPQIVSSYHPIVLTQMILAIVQNATLDFISTRLESVQLYLNIVTRPDQMVSVFDVLLDSK